MKAKLSELEKANLRAEVEDDEEFFGAMNVILERDFREVRARVQKAVDDSPKSVTLEEALKQQQKFMAHSAIDSPVPF